MTKHQKMRAVAGLLTGFAVFALAPVASAAPAAPVVSAGSDTAGLQRELQALVTDGGVAGALAELRLDGRTVWRGGAGTADLATGQPVEPQGRFRIGSVTKTFVATVILQLSAEGRVDLDAPIERYLPGVVPDGDVITVRQVLNHTAGIFNYTDDPHLLPQDEAGWRQWVATGRYRTYQPAQLVALAVSHPPYFAPGQGWHYSNTDYVLAGMLVEQVTGDRWQDEVRRRILDPLGLRQTSFPATDPEVPGPHVHGYLQLPTGPADVTEENPSWAGSAGDGISTADDLARFNATLLNGELLAPAQLSEMETITAPAAAGQYGLGLQKFTLPCTDLWGHEGSLPGYQTLVAGDPTAHRQLVISISPYDNSKQAALDAASLKLIDRAFCGG